MKALLVTAEEVIADVGAQQVSGRGERLGGPRIVTRTFTSGSGPRKSSSYIYSTLLSCTFGYFAVAWFCNACFLVSAPPSFYIKAVGFVERCSALSDEARTTR